MSKTPEELFQEREKRIMDSVHLEQTDRPPILIAFTYFPAIYAGIQKKAAWYDHDAWFDATMKTIEDHAPDGIWSIQGYSNGPVQELLEPNTQKWPGWGLADDNEHQAIEVAGMTDKEFDEYFNNKGEFALRTMLGRFVRAAEPFKKLPPPFPASHPVSVQWDWLKRWLTLK